jgi:alkanesulfonate monooxygenase SsuD/methylene tetrahydromethanopterin reductase-like flavin-dependent oxidoreductase (luciferase family)
MKFGLQATSVHGRETPPAQQLAEHRELIGAAEEMDFELLSCGQHFLGEQLRYYQPIPYLAHLCQFAPRMRVATGIILLSLVNPIEVAEQIAVLDVITDGRATLGVGLGYADREFRAFGVDRKTRVGRFEESLEVIKKLWSGEPFEHLGKHFEIEQVDPVTLPVQSPRPPIWIGAQSEKAVRRAARIADGWYVPPFPTHSGLAALREVYLEEREAQGLPAAGDFPVRRELVVAADRDSARREADMRSRGRFETYLKMGLGSDLDSHAGEFGGTDAQDLEERFVLGNAEECAEQLLDFERQVGMTHFVIKPQWPGLPHVEAMRQMERFAEVVELTRSASPA